MDPGIRLFYVTCPDSETAKKISLTVMKEGLAACANILAGMESLYWWQGKIDSAKEVVLILKTSTSQEDRLLARVESLHPYNTPCILSLPVEKGSEPYVRWLKGSLF